MHLAHRLIALSSVLSVGGSILLVTGCETLEDLTPTQAKEWIDRKDVQSSLGELRGKQAESKAEVQDTYAALQAMADAPAEEAEVYYAQYNEASAELRSHINGYAELINDVETDIDAEVSKMMAKIERETNVAARKMTERNVESLRDSSDSLFDQSRQITARLVPLADQLDAQAREVHQSLVSGTSGTANTNLSAVKNEVDKLIAEFDEGADDLEEVVDEVTNDGQTQ